MRSDSRTPGSSSTMSTRLVLTGLSTASPPSPRRVPLRNGQTHPHLTSRELRRHVGEYPVEERSDLDRLRPRRRETGELERVLEEVVHAPDCLLGEAREALPQLGVLEQRRQVLCKGLDRDEG